MSTYLSDHAKLICKVRLVGSKLEQEKNKKTWNKSLLDKEIKIEHEEEEMRRYNSFDVPLEPQPFFTEVVGLNIIIGENQINQRAGPLI